MKDLYKKSNFPTRIDIYDKENFVKTSYHDTRFDIEICMGRPVDKTIGASKIIFTEELKKFILETKHLSYKAFKGKLKPSTVQRLRRKLMENPYPSYQAWVESKDKNKPKEVRQDTKNNPEFITDYFGVKYLVVSATMTKEGLVFPMGVEKRFYHTRSKHTISYIYTHEVFSIIKEYRFYPRKGIHKFPFGEQTFIALKKKLGYTESTYKEVNLWLAGHIEEIVSMTIKGFYSQYASHVHISINSVKTLKAYFNYLIKCDNKTLLIIQKYNHTKKKSDREKLNERIGEYITISVIRVYYILTLAKEHNHTIPKSLQHILPKN